jgi:acyl carrier protein
MHAGDEVITEIARLVDTPAEDIDRSTHIADLVPDSFMLIELAIELEERFDVRFRPEHLRQVHTVGDIVDLVVGDAAGLTARSLTR